MFICSKLVGQDGRVIGVDMTEQQLAFARQHEVAQLERFGFERSNVEFHRGFIEDLGALGIADNSVDVVISNCVINLSPFKDQVFREICRVLKPGGELYFSDIFSDRRVPPHFYDDPVLRGECLSGALYIDDFRRILAKHGIDAFYDVETEPLQVGDFQIETKLGCIGFASHTVRAIKCADLEDREENYGQVATYRGTIPENARYFDLSEDLRLIKGKPVAISGNMATMLASSRYGAHFKIDGDRERHVGPYDYGKAQESLELARGKRRVSLENLRQSCEELGIEPFSERVHDKALLKSAPALTTMQVNVGYRCNLACNHCFLECGPHRTETMDRDTMQAVLGAFEAGRFKTLDVTGGAPEANPHLPWFLGEASSIAHDVIVRSNLAILDQVEYHDLLQTYAAYKVHVVASLPYFNDTGCDLQRGRRTFDRAVAVLREMNGLGYGVDPALKIDLVYNVSGPFLPPEQRELEDFYTYELRREQGVVFNNLFAFNNYAFGRFANQLKHEGKFDHYLNLLSENYNGAVVARMMCRSQVSVDFDGGLYDCEANHAAGLPFAGPRNVRDIVDRPLGMRDIVTSPLCYTCAAGCGSSCGGSLMDKYAD